LVDVVCTRGKISEIDELFGQRQSPDVEAGWVAPALFDLQINGCQGRSFNSPRLTADDIGQVVAVCRAHGLGGFCPTLVSNSAEALTHGLETIARVCDSEGALARAIPAVHLEGPYISPEDGPRGAHPLEHIRPPDWEEFQRLQEASGGRIRLVTLAPECPGALPFIERLVARGVVVALGHTAASGEQIRAAVTAGACLSTHLGNGTHATLPRHDNYLWEQLAADGLWASVICDGHHLPPALIKCILRVKTPARAVLTCDASSLAGLPPGRYNEWGQELEVLSDGKVVVPGTPFLAGSGVFTDTCVGIAVRDGGVTLREALDMAGARPRSLLGLDPPALAPGHPADLVLLDWQPDGPIRVAGTVINGELIRPVAAADQPSQ
jgi:N-acetylglucosamine-6-phosphate deacetylase